MAAPRLREALRDEAFTQVDAVNPNARDDAPVTIAPAARQRFHVARFGDPFTEIGSRRLGEGALLPALRAMPTFWGVNVFDPIALVPLPKGVAVDDGGVG